MLSAAVFRHAALRNRSTGMSLYSRLFGAQGAKCSSVCNLHSCRLWCMVFSAGKGSLLSHSLGEPLHASTARVASTTMYTLLAVPWAESTTTLLSYLRPHSPLSATFIRVPLNCHVLLNYLTVLTTDGQDCAFSIFRFLSDGQCHAHFLIFWLFCLITTSMYTFVFYFRLKVHHEWLI